MLCWQQVHSGIGQPLVKKVLIGCRNQRVISSAHDLHGRFNRRQLLGQLGKLGGIRSDVERRLDKPVPGIGRKVVISDICWWGSPRRSVIDGTENVL